MMEEDEEALLASEASDSEAEAKTQKRVQVFVKTSKKKDRGTFITWRYVHQFDCPNCRSTYHVKATWPALPDKTKCAICEAFFLVKDASSATMTMRKFKTDLPLTMLF